ncbi:hypothetical protein DYBT9623_00685 [Dyadobacter sp. CECT 9623]|uniref:Uncharacterized protein n=1 Tax=Dyadobacter linearis TaxID=2823330 RepID=A0ABM8UKR3_9BACT|nr:hypothetical protein [Dyadobacter sp. CECT 9623]CAG5067957.1 hypothetical protein DYBT9623_00685 [Dyadobacter sp. CECT 9623]
MEQSELQIPELGILHLKTDPFNRVFEIEKEDGTPFILEGFNPVWEIYHQGELILSMEGSDFVFNGNLVTVDKPSTFFKDLSKLSDYTHRFYDRSTQTTFFKGPFKLS